MTSSIKAANSEGLKLVRGLLITVSATGSDQEHYVRRNVMKLSLSKAACQDFGIIGDNFPWVGSSDNIHSLNKCKLVDLEKSDI